MTTNYPTPQSRTILLRDFRFQSGAVMPEVHIHVRTVGSPENPPVLVLHATASSADDLLNLAFAGELLGAGQPLDASQYFIILPDSLGAGQSSKPSDGLRASFPEYDYADMVHAQHRALTEGMGIHHLRLILGHSMGGMHAWIWATQHPHFMDAIVPMACAPLPMAGRNWMMRRFIVDSIRRDPAWLNGHYVKQPPSAQFASVFANAATSGGVAALHAAAPNASAADQWLDAKLRAPFKHDANDLIYQWQASRNYNPSEALHQIKAAVMAINAADDERNPPDLEALAQIISRIPNAALHLIPLSTASSGHSTTAQAALWKEVLVHFLEKLRD